MYDCEAQHPGFQNPCLVRQSSGDHWENIVVSGKLYGAYHFYPKEIFCQIVIIQAIFYAALSLQALIVLGLLEYPRNVKLLFRAQALRWFQAHPVSRVLFLFHIFTAVIMAQCIARLVERTRKCLDFVVTMYLFHLSFCYLSSGFHSTSISFWFLMLLCTTISTLLARRICMKTELEEIILLKRKNAKHHYTLEQKNQQPCCLELSAHSVRRDPAAL